MKRDVIVKVLLISFLFVFLLSGVLAVSSGSCDIVARGECTGDSTNGYIVMGLSSSTNAHGELASEENYNHVLCCNIGTGNTSCSGTNKIIGLSSKTNAHAEIPSEDNYDEDVCYENLICTHRSSCNEGEGEVLSLSDVTNAHIEGTGDYNVKICCSGLLSPVGCNLESARWVSTEAIYIPGVGGEKVYLEVIGSGSECDGKAVSFKVTEGGIVSQGPAETQPDNGCFNEKKGQYIAGGEWYAEWVNDLGTDPEYYFNATLVNAPSVFVESSDPKLKVTKQSEDYCSSIAVCEDYISKEDCESDESLCDVAGDSSLPGVDCDDENTICECAWDEDEGTCGFGYVELSEDECGTPSEGCNYGCTLCESETTGYYCKLGSSCPSGEIPGDNDGTCESGIDGCLSEDCGDGDRDSCASPYYCSGGKCLSIDLPLSISGKCEVTQIIESDCDEDPVGYKTIRITGVWKGEGECEEACQKCQEMNNEVLTVPCPAQIQLPFFGWQSAVIIIAVIIIIYIIWKYKKKEVKRKTPSRTKSKRKKRKISKKK